MAANNIVVVFDFDETIIDCDSDFWVVDQLGATALFKPLLHTVPLNSLMDTMMRELMQSQGKTINDIERALSTIPVHPNVVPAIKTVHALGCDLKIVSDANSFFIRTVLDHLGIAHCFSEIFTNPSFLDQQGTLRIQPFNNLSHPHGCTNPCPPNMCKGVIIEKLLSTLPDKKFIYLGDGAGDYCPSLKLREEDHLMPRNNFPVWNLICKNPMLIKAAIHDWTEGAELAQILLRTIAQIVPDVQDHEENISSSSMSVDWKSDTSMMPTTYRVPQRSLAMPH